MFGEPIVSKIIAVSLDRLNAGLLGATVSSRPSAAEITAARLEEAERRILKLEAELAELRALVLPVQ
jgi:hypothetical protein